MEKVVPTDIDVNYVLRAYFVVAGDNALRIY